MVALSNSVNNNADLLDLSSIVEYTPITKIAYVHDVKVGLTRYDSFFVTFILKDCHANTIAARLFNVENSDMSSVTATAMKHKPVKFTGNIQEFNGSFSIVIDGVAGISLYDGPFNYDSFIGTVAFDLSDVESALASTKLHYDCNEWGFSSIDQLCEGRVGAYARLAEIAFNALSPLVSDNNRDDVYTAFGVALQYYFSSLKEKQHLDVIENLNAYRILGKIDEGWKGQDIRLILIDTVRSVLGLAQPLHLYSHWITNAIRFAQDALNLEIKFNSMPLGTKINFGGGQLSKY